MFDSTKVLTPEVKTLGEVFSKEGFALRVVGGAVRDLFLDKTPKDIDFTTDATPSEMITILEAAGWHTIPTGIEHGTISVLGSLEEPYEITTLRIDAATDGRHADVEFTRDFRIDAERRDLTFNAMSMDMDGNVFDYFGGQYDLENKVVKFVGDAESRIKEDYLRILRFFRFMARLNAFSVPEETMFAISDNAHGLRQISGERIWAEMSKILASDNPLFTLSMMHTMGVLGVDAAAGIPNDLSGLHAVESKNPVTVLAALCRSQADVDSVVARFKISTHERNLLTFLVSSMKPTMTEAKVATTFNMPKEWLSEMFLMHGNVSYSEAILAFDVPKFPVSGKDLLDAGMKAGPAMGEALRDMQHKWADSGFTLTKTDLL